MAAFQGQRFIADQLRSILVQLSENDEVIVVDDHSSDGTREEVRSLCDRRLHLIEHATNQGIAKTFEEAILHANGSVIFLSDQDDIWIEGKVAKILRAFEDNPHVSLVVTDALLMDEAGNPLESSYYESRGSFRSGFLANLFRSKFLGCTMAFRSKLVPKILPFPRDCGDVVHDFWIGVVNSITIGNTLYINEPLVRYRRHSAAATGGTLTRSRQLRIRFELLRAILNFWTRNRLGRRAGA
jgi:glycosyltransferase involved in cell wall biosynthesis